MKIHRRSIIIALSLLSLFIGGCNSGSTDSNNSNQQWVVFSKSSVPDLLDDNIHGIYVINSDYILFGTDSGVVKYQGGSWSYLPPDSFAYPVQPGPTYRRDVYPITKAFDQSLWFGLGQGGIRRYNQNSSTIAWQKYDIGLVCRSMAVSPLDRGSVWIATNAGAYEYVFPEAPALPTAGHLVQAPTSSGVSSVDCHVSISPTTGNIYFGTINATICYYDLNDEAWHIRSINQGYQSPITAITVDYSGTIWCGKQTGVTFYNPATDTMYDFTPENTSNKLPAAMINAVGTDYIYKTRWFGSSMGLSQLKDTTWTFFNTSNTSSLPSNHIQALGYDMVRRNLWIGTDKGIVVFNETGVTLK
jgi:ligand-binding sensor domain-containing protein